MLKWIAALPFMDQQTWILKKQCWSFVLFCCDFSLMPTWPQTPYALVWSPSLCSPVLYLGLGWCFRDYNTRDSFLLPKKKGAACHWSQDGAGRVIDSGSVQRPPPFHTVAARPLPLPLSLLNAALNAGLHFLLRLWPCWTCCVFPFFFFCSGSSSSSYEVCRLVCVCVCVKVLQLPN